MREIYNLTLKATVLNGWSFRWVDNPDSIALFENECSGDNLENGENENNTLLETFESYNYSKTSTKKFMGVIS
jgi:hypothetical protein